MSFVTNVLTPIITVSAILGIGVWLCFIFYKLTRKFLNKFFRKFKKKKTEYDEKTVELCMRSIDLGWSKEKFMVVLLESGKSPNQIAEISILFDEIKIKMDKKEVK